MTSPRHKVKTSLSIIRAVIVDIDDMPTSKRRQWLGKYGDPLVTAMDQVQEYASVGPNHYDINRRLQLVRELHERVLNSCTDDNVRQWLESLYELEKVV